jgi:uncharacterized protein (TIGR02270 family)
MKWREAGREPTSIPTVVAQHAEEAAFLWELRDRAVVAPHYTYEQLCHLDDRVEAHIDGLRVGGEAGWGVCAEQLEWADAGEVFAAAVVALENGEPRRWRKVLEVATSSRDAGRGLVAALEWLPHDRVAERITALVTSSVPGYRCVGIAAAAAHRLGVDRAVEDALDASDGALRARALRAAGELGLRGLLPSVAAGLTDSSAECRYSAAWSVALLGGIEAIAPLQEFATAESPYQEEAAATALRCMNLPAATVWQREITQTPHLQRLGVLAAGVVGDAVAVPWLIEQMSRPDLARVAGEAFSMITGVDLGLQDLEGQRPDGFASGPTEDPKDDDVAMDPDENLRWPDAARVDKWWHAHGTDFRVGRRYLLGKPIRKDSLEEALRSGFQRQRAAAAVELALLRPGQPLFEVRAPGHRQQALLGLSRRPV